MRHTPPPAITMDEKSFSERKNFSESGRIWAENSLIRETVWFNKNIDPKELSEPNGFLRVRPDLIDDKLFDSKSLLDSQQFLSGPGKYFDWLENLICGSTVMATIPFFVFSWSRGVAPARLYSIFILFLFPPRRRAIGLIKWEQEHGNWIIAPFVFPPCWGREESLIISWNREQEQQPFRKS